MNRFSRKLSIFALGLAMGAAVPAFAADDDAGGNNKTVQRGDVPAAVQQTIQQRIPAGAEVTEYIRRGNGANQIFAAHYKQPGQKGQQKIFVSSSGQFLLGPIPGDEKVTQAQIERAAANAVPGVAAPAIERPLPPVGRLTPEQARSQISELQAREDVLTRDLDQRASQIRQADQQIRDLQARGGAGNNGQIDSLRAQQREWQTISDRNRTELSQNQQRQREVAAAGGIELPANTQVAGARLPRDVGAPAADPLYDRDRDDQATNARFSRVTADQVPPSARQALDKYTRDQRDVEYRRDVEGDRVYYTAHYVTNDGNRHWLTVNENGTNRVGPKISAYPTGSGTDLARTASGREPAPVAGGPADAGYRTISQADVPKPVMQGILRVADGQGAHDWQYLRSERGGQTNYSVIYTDKNNRRQEARLDDRGNVIEQPHAARDQAAPLPAAGHDTPAANNTLKSVDQRDVPKAVISTVTREANNQGGHDWQYFRVGQDDYVVRYTTKDNRKMETRIDNSGQVVEAPHAPR